MPNLFLSGVSRDSNAGSRRIWQRHHASAERRTRRGYGMRGKHPYLPLYTGDWKKDPELSNCSPATRGIWIDILCTMHDSDAASLTGTIDQLSRQARCSNSEMLMAVCELRDTRTALVVDHQGKYTLSCRRLLRKQALSKIRSKSGSKGGSTTVSKREATPYDIENEIEVEGARSRVREFARGEGIGERDADWFFWKCEGNGWTNGGKPILDWKATIRSWWKGGFFPSQKPQQQFRFGGRLSPAAKTEQQDKEDREWEEHKARQAERKRQMREQHENTTAAGG
jgi:hypothetical protein